MEYPQVLVQIKNPNYRRQIYRAIRARIIEGGDETRVSVPLKIKDTNSKDRVSGLVAAAFTDGPWNEAVDLYSKYPGAKIIRLENTSGYSRDDYKRALNQLGIRVNYGQVGGYVTGTSSLDPLSLAQQVTTIRGSRNCRIPNFKAGIIGWGTFGRAYREALREVEEVIGVEAFSHYYFHSQKGYSRLIKIEEENEGKGSRAEFRSTPEEVFEKCDLVAICVGKRDNFRGHSDKGRTATDNEQMFWDHIERVDEALDAAKRVNYTGLIAMITNPETFMKYAVRRGINPRTIFGCPNDNPRARRLICNHIAEGNPEDFSKSGIKPEDIVAPVVFTHARPQILWPLVRIGQYSLRQIDPALALHEEEQERFNAIYWDYGRQVMEEGHYSGTPRFLKKLTNWIAHFKEVNDSIGVFSEKYNYDYWDFPPQINYTPEGVVIEAKKVGWKIPAKILSKMEEESRRREELINRALHRRENYSEAV